MYVFTNTTQHIIILCWIALIGGVKIMFAIVVNYKRNVMGFFPSLSLIV